MYYIMNKDNAVAAIEAKPLFEGGRMGFARRDIAGLLPLDFTEINNWLESERQPELVKDTDGLMDGFFDYLMTQKDCAELTISRRKTSDTAQLYVEKGRLAITIDFLNGSVIIMDGGRTISPAKLKETDGDFGKADDAIREALRRYLELHDDHTFHDYYFPAKADFRVRSNADILSFVNSRDIREHLRGIGYEFSTLEAAWLICQSKNASVAQKHQAYKDIIDTMPDCHIGNRRSLRKYLKELIKREDEDILSFRTDDSRHIYMFRFHSTDDDTWREAETGAF